MRRPSGVSSILAATAVASLAGFVVIVVVPGQVGLAAYKPFGVFWSAMYLAVSALSGVQQEVTRGTRSRTAGSEARLNPARNFGVVAALGVSLVVVTTAPLWVDQLFPDYGWSMVWPLAVACGSYVLVATLVGTLYGMRKWVPLATMISVDAVLRLIVVLALSTFTSSTLALAWAAALPFLVTIAVLWPAFRRTVVGRTTLDVGYRELTWNVTRTVVASASAGVIVSGLPVVIGLASRSERPEDVSALFVAVTLTRAPVIVVVMSLQSYLLVWFRDDVDRLVNRVLTIVSAIAAGSVVLALIAWLAAPHVFGLIYAGSIELEGWFYSVLVLSSGLIGVMCVLAAAVLVRSRHLVYSLGWLAAAVVTAACFFVPGPLVARTAVAVLLGPAVGCAVHFAALLMPSIRATSPAKA